MEVGAFYSEQIPHFKPIASPTHSFSVTGHGVHHETIDGLLSAMKAYFSLPLETKMKVAFPLVFHFILSLRDEKLYHKTVGNFQGYAPLLDSNIDPSNRGDLLEAFGVGWKLLVLENDETSGNNDLPKAGTNIWPLEPAGFREAYLNY